MPKFYCIHCGQHIDAVDTLAGTTAVCPTCGGDIEVPKLIELSDMPRASGSQHPKPLPGERLGILTRVRSMFGMGRRKVDEDEFEQLLVPLLDSYQRWQGGEHPQIAPELAEHLRSFQRILPRNESYDRLAKALGSLIRNQLRMMASLTTAQASFNPERPSFAGMGKVEIYRNKMWRSAARFLEQVELLEESDPVRSLLVQYEAYSPTAGS